MVAKKTKPPVPTSDEVRKHLIQWFYNLNKKGGAPRGMKDLCKEIKEEHGYKAPLVKEHLTYLVDLEYIYKEVTMTKVQTGQTYRDQARTAYRIYAKGIEFMEGKSQFSDKDRYPGINITATGGSTIVLGDGNVVNQSYHSIYEELSRFRQAIADSTELNDSQKLEASVSVDTIKSQLALPNPDKTIVERAWDAANKLCTTATLTEYATRLAPLLAALFV